MEFRNMNHIPAMALLISKAIQHRKSILENGEPVTQFLVIRHWYLYFSLKVQCHQPTFVTSSCILVLKILPMPFLPLIFFFLCESLFLEGGEFCGSLAYYGVGTNLVSYLTKVRKQSNVTAASNIASWQGTCYLTPLLGAFLADSYWGRHRTIVVSLTIFTIVTLDRHSTLFFVKSASAC